MSVVWLMEVVLCLFTSTLSDLLCSRRCLPDHPHQTLEKEALQYTPQLVKTCVKQIEHEGGVLETNSFLGMLFNDG